MGQPNVPEKPSLEGLEGKWGASWEQAATYAFDRRAARADVFSIDTPPPTVSGSLHVGHIFSYTHTDTVARYQRMQGKDVFYPMGWDDNGLPTERRVENFYGVRCDPTVPYVDGYAPPEKPGKKRQDFDAISRRNFVELCEQLTATDEQVFEDLFRLIGLSVDWSLSYTTVSQRSQRTSQRAFLRNLARGEAYSSEAPSLWDTTFQTAVAQAELEDRERPAAYHDLAFHRRDGGPDVVISTTRPELLVSCVALVAHPDDERYQPLFGSTVTTPVFGVEVPVKAHKLAEPDKGTGIAMICTFGDLTDVIWWRELQLETRAVVGKDGRFRRDAPEWLPTDAARSAYDQFAGKASGGAQQVMVELLADSGELIGEPRKINHPVKFFEKGDKPLEIVTTRQWYIRNGGRSEELRSTLLDRGAELNWHPDYMRHRYDNWVGGLNGDWLISRQRFFGVPIPLWYRLDADGVADHDQPLTPPESALPVDPQADVPDGFTADQRDQPGGFTADPDIMDTWATSSLTPQIACGWEEDAELFAATFPMDVRPQAHEIIRTWLFSTVVRSHYEHGTVPWANAALSGWILDPDRKKMSKSVGNVVVPTDLLEQHGADAVRYWAAGGRPGTDTAFDPGQMKIGRRLAIKVLNASKFALGLGEAPADAAVTEPLDLTMLAELAGLVDDATRAFDGFDYARALQRTEDFFWSFCDDYLELVKGRAYRADDPAAVSARVALRIALNTLLRLFAPFLPYVTEEVWSWCRADGDALPGFEAASVHRASWPTSSELRAVVGDQPEAAGTPSVLVVAAEVLGRIRKAKSDAKVSMRAEVATVVVTDTHDRTAALLLAASDVCDAGKVAELSTALAADGVEGTVEVTLAEVPAE
ncbi:valine--tRNA ligase [Aquihabitans sp. G128]|uniref:valine--tRNA ligase n=1 Tax=Aquihabitans sp. G128 TaxID=2849779 RepID=UPI001C23186D|nr:valine--tRNA ligase [Aquihabitans sp. G128]QXC60824.1 valine--tRNA ligase [Aquihabitans sp. G128]